MIRSARSAAGTWVAVHEAPTVLLALGLVALLGPLFADTTTTVPVGAAPEPVTVRLALLLPVLAAALTGSALGSGVAELERVAARSLVLPRLVWLSVLLVPGLSLAATALLAGATPGDAAVVARNVVAAAGASALAASVLGSGLAWLPFTAYTLASLILGTLDQEQQGTMFAAWAWVADQRLTTPGLLATALLALVGAACYAIRGARS